MRNPYEPTKRQIRNFKKTIKKELKKRCLEKFNNKKIIEYIALDIMTISYSKGGDYTEKCLNGFMKGYFNKNLAYLDVKSITSSK